MHAARPPALKSVGSQTFDDYVNMLNLSDATSLESPLIRLLFNAPTNIFLFPENNMLPEQTPNFDPLQQLEYLKNSRIAFEQQLLKLSPDTAIFEGKDNAALKKDYELLYKITGEFVSVCCSVAREK